MRKPPATTACPLCHRSPLPVVDDAVQGTLAIGQHSHPMPIFPFGYAGPMYEVNCPMSGMALRLHEHDRTAPELAETISVSNTDLRVGDQLVQWSINGADWKPVDVRNGKPHEPTITSLADDRLRCGVDTYSRSDSFRWRVRRSAVTP